MLKVPDNPKLVSHLSKLLEAKNLQEAIDLAARAIELDPYNPELSYRKAELDLRAKRGEAALEAVSQAISLQPYNKRHELLLCRIRAFMEEDNDFQEAIELARIAAERHPDDHEFSYLVAELLLRSERGEEALTYLRAKLSPQAECGEVLDGVTPQPARGEYLLLMSQAYHLLGDLNASVKAAKCAVNLVADERKSLAIRNLRRIRVRRWLGTMMRYVLRQLRRQGPTS